MNRDSLITDIKQLLKLIELERGKVKAHKDTVEALKWRDRERIAAGVSNIVR